MPNYNAVARQGPMKGVLGWTGWMDKKRGEGLGRGGRVGGGSSGGYVRVWMYRRCMVLR